MSKRPRTPLCALHLFPGRMQPLRFMILLSALSVLALAGPRSLAQGKQSPDSLPGAKKPAPASVSHLPTAAKQKGKTKVTLYPASAQETADAIVADSLGRLFDQTDEHFHQGEYNHVVALDRIVAQGDPHNVETYANSAWLLWSTDRNDEAIATLKQGIKANPDTYYMYDELGSHYLMRLHDPVSAAPLYEKAVTFPCPYTTWHNLAHCYEKTKQWDKVVTAWEGAAQYGNDSLAQPRLARARAERDKHKNEQVK